MQSNRENGLRECDQAGLRLIRKSLQVNTALISECKKNIDGLSHMTVCM